MGGGGRGREGGGRGGRGREGGGGERGERERVREGGRQGGGGGSQRSLNLPQDSMWRRFMK